MSNLRCVRCCHVVARRVIIPWLKRSICKPRDSLGSLNTWTPRTNNNAAVVVGNQPPHASHKLHYYHGVWRCGACGGYASAGDAKTGVRKLGKPCCGKLSRAGRCTIKRIMSQNKPRGNFGWPVPLHTAEEKRLVLPQLRPTHKLTQKISMASLSS